MANLVFDFLHNYVTGERRASDPADAYQYDEGHVLEAVVPVAVASCEIQYWIRGMEKADAYTPTSITQNTDNTYTILGNIPNSYFETNGDLRVYIVVTDGNASITTYEGYIHIKERQMPEDYVDDDPDNDAVQIIAAARGYAETSEAWAVGQINGEDVPSTADQYQNNASYYANQAASAASSAAAQASLAPAYDNTATYAVGDYCLHDGRLYECTTAITTAEAWTAAHWTAVTVGGELSNLKEDLTAAQVELAKKANIDGYYEDMTVGNAEQLVSTVTNADDTPYNFRTTAGSADVGDRAYVDAVVGGSIVWNQLVTDDISHVEMSTALSWNTFTPFAFSLMSGHKYLVMFIGKTVSGGGLGIRDIDTGVLYRPAQPSYSLIYSATTNTNNTTFVQGNWDTGTTDAYLMVFDLTQTFGTAIADYVYSLETATAGAGVAWLKEHFPKIFDSGYIAYNTGTLVHVSGLSAHKTVGFNQWDEEWENGFINDAGQNSALATALRAKNYISVIPNTAYFVCCPRNVYVFYYGENKNFITKDTAHGSGGNLRNEAFTIPQNVHYMRFTMYNTPTYNHDICINLSDPTKNGTYEPYTEHTYPLDSSIDLHGILKLDSNNNLYADGDVYKPDGNVSRRYGVVDLGTLTWAKYDVAQGTLFRAEVNSIKQVTSTSTVPSLVCPKYVTVAQQNRAEKTISMTNNSYSVDIIDSAYSDATAFKAAMSGVMLLYELATPTTETAEPYQHVQICDDFGTEEYVSTSIVPVGHNTKYPDNLRKKLDDLPWNFATLIAPTESTYKATRNYTTGSLFIVNNVLYKATANIANGGTITPNTNCTATTLAEVISALS